MFSEILKIIPKLDSSSLNGMERGLNDRFKKVSKKFGGALKIASIAALGSAFLSQILSPLKEVRGIIDSTLGRADDVTTFAEQFNTTTEKLLQLQSLASLKGVDADGLNVLLGKFQSARAEAKADPNKPSSVRNFLTNEDTADAFFQFLQARQKLNPDERNLVDQNVFGEKQILKNSEFFGSNWEESFNALKTVDFSSVASAAAALEKLESKSQINKTILGLVDLVQKGGGSDPIINKGTISSMAQADMAKQLRENKQIADFKTINDVDMQLEEIKELIRTTTTTILKELPFIMSSVKSSVSGWGMIADFLKSPPKGIKYPSKKE